MKEKFIKIFSLMNVLYPEKLKSRLLIFIILKHQSKSRTFLKIKAQEFILFTTKNVKLNKIFFEIKIMSLR
jgi:hypothetical protein